MKSPPSLEWIEQLKEGNNRVLTDLLKNYGAYCISNLGRLYNCERADAEDVLMDALIKFRKNVLDGKVTNDQNLKAYIFTICKNTYLKKYHSRKSEKEKQKDLLFYFFENRYDEESYDHLIRDENFEETNAKKLALVKVVLDALHSLSDKCQRIIRMQFVEEKTMEEIATALQFDNRNVAKSTKYRCFKQWRSIIDQALELQK